MTVEEIIKFIEENVPVFTNPEIVYDGESYHYTMHSDLIDNYGRFLGRPVDDDMDHTQLTLTSIPASADEGVVYSYEDFEAAMKEGYVMPSEKDVVIYLLRYKKAIRTIHSQEETLDAPLTIIIRACDIIDYKIVYPKP